MSHFRKAGEPKVISISSRGHRETVDILRDQSKLITIAIQTFRQLLTRNWEMWLDVARQGYQFRRVQSQVIDYSRTNTLAEILTATKICARLKVREQVNKQFAETFPKEIPPHKAIQWLKNLEIVTREIWEFEMAQSRQAAFFITGVEQTETLRVIQKAIEDSLEHGHTLAQFEAGIRDQLQDLALTGGRLRNVWHNNVSSAYTHTRDEELGQPDVAAVLPYFLFDALVDGVVRPNHKALENGIAPQTWEGWEKYKPLLGFNCRCCRIAITAGRAHALLASGEAWDMTQGVPAEAGMDPGYIRMAS